MDAPYMTRFIEMKFISSLTLVPEPSKEVHTLPVQIVFNMYYNRTAHTEKESECPLLPWSDTDDT